MSPDGGGTRVRASLRARSLRLSSDGRRLVLTKGSWTRSRLGVANADGSGFRALTDSASAWYNLAWSPDDRWIAATRSDSTGSLRLWLLDPGTGRPSELVRLAAAARPQWPAWSPDGRTIAFQAGASDSTGSARDVYIHTVDVATGRIRRLREHPRPMLDEAPCWLGAGSIVFQSTQSGAFELWVMRADGTGARRLTR
jgi:TolB protein